jgi:trehalose 6-phosphate phosphatase
MRSIFSSRGYVYLRAYASRKVLLAFDYDGTLSPITHDPRGTVMRPRTKKLLRTLTEKYPCIIVSGRGRKDVQRRLHGIRFKEILGNHGIEPWQSSRAMSQRVRTWMPTLRECLKPFPAAYLEDKKYSVSIHYRMEPQKMKAARVIREATNRLSGARILSGKQVINIIPVGAQNKGLAVEAERRRQHCDCVIYVGDDQTDEDAFSIALDGRLLGIRVGVKRSSCAHFYIHNQLEMDRLLSSLISFRPHRA